MEGGAEAEDTPRMEINDLHVSRVSSQFGRRLRDRGSQADTGNGSLVGAQLGNYSQRSNLIREHKTKNANHCRSKSEIDFSNVFIGAVCFKSTH